MFPFVTEAQNLFITAGPTEQVSIAATIMLRILELHSSRLVRKLVVLHVLIDST